MYLYAGAIMKRNIITIDENLCNGCGNCVPECPEGALQIIDGKARLVSDLFCDGLGACIGECPTGALTVEKREAEPYDEAKVMENIIKAGPNTIKAHLKHLLEHGETELYKEALAVLKEKNISVPEDHRAQNRKKDNPKQIANIAYSNHAQGGCPGSAIKNFITNNHNTESGENHSGVQEKTSAADHSSALTHWPVQLHLLSPHAPYLYGSDVLLAADCSAFSVGAFHATYLKGHTLAIACPKLDQGINNYIEKLTVMIDEAKINTLTVLIMQVPCCGGLIQIAKKAVEKASRNIPIKKIVISLEGKEISHKWL